MLRYAICGKLATTRQRKRQHDLIRQMFAHGGAGGDILPHLANQVLGNGLGAHFLFAKSAKDFSDVLMFQRYQQRISWTLIAGYRRARCNAVSPAASRWERYSF